MMSQTPALIAALKKQLKADGKTYADVAKALDLSEASVKRLFAEQSFTLQRIEAVCQLVGIQFTELVMLMAKDQPQLQHLTLEQEQRIAEDIELLLVSVSVINGYTFADLAHHYRLSSQQIIRRLAQLDRLRLIELLPNNRIKLLVAPNFKWLPNGPIQTFFHDKVEKEFFRSRFDGEEEKLLVLNGLLSRSSNNLIQQRMQKLSQEFNELMHADAALPMSEKYGNTIVMALRHWQFELFREYLR